MQRYLVIVSKLENSMVFEGDSVNEICLKYFVSKRRKIKRQVINKSQISEIEWKCTCQKETFYVKKILFENETRNRKYGLREGDIVISSQFKKKAVVEDLVLADNNRVHVRTYDGTITVVAEWLKIIKKVEE